MKMVLLSRLYPAGHMLLEGKLDMKECFTDNPWEAIDEIRQAECILIGNQRFDRALFNEAVSLRILAKQGSGTDNIDLEAAADKGITVVTSPGANAKTVAEHVMMLILAASRNLHMYDKNVRSGNFGIRSSCNESGLYGKQIGLIGYGRIGKEVALYSRAFGMNVSVYDPYVKDADGISCCKDLDELCTASDIISIHVPRTPDTVGMISAEVISKMKKGAVLVNCSRGGIVDENALYDALRSGKLHAAGIDVFANEPASANNPLFSLDNIVVTPHSAALTKETADAMSIVTAEGILKAIQER